jgi:hypothetical protein
MKRQSQAREGGQETSSALSALVARATRIAPAEIAASRANDLTVETPATSVEFVGRNLVTRNSRRKLPRQVDSWEVEFNAASKRSW